MRPSELRRQERRSWLGFLAICLGSVLIVVVIAIGAEHIGEPRWDPDRAVADESTGPAVPRGPAPRHVVRTLGDSIRATARAVQGTLESERQVEIAGATAFLPGGVRLTESVHSLEDGGQILLVLFYRSRSGEANRAVGHLSLDSYRREGDTWQPLEFGLLELDVELGAAGADGILTAEGITLRKAGQRILAIELPRHARCDPATTSDVARRYTAYVEIDANPRLIYGHVSAGARGNRPEERLEVQLTWSEREGDLGRGEMTFVRHYAGEAAESWRVAFEQQGDRFAIATPANALLADIDRAAVEAAIEGTDPAAAERLLRHAIEGLETVGSLEGASGFCVGMPHRQRLPDPITRERWRDRIDERVFDLQLHLAEVLARQGRGREALDVFGLDDPGLVLSSTSRRRELIQLLQGPRVATLRMLPDVELDERPVWYRGERREHLEMPMRWIDDQRILVPRAVARPTLTPGLAMRVPAALLGAAAASATPIAAHVPDRERPPARLRALATGALHPVLPLRLEHLLAVELGTAAASGASHKAREVFDDLVDKRGLYVGARYPTLDVLGGSFTESSWEALQVYAPLADPYDLSPGGERLLIDQGASCAGGFVQVCLDRPSLCRDGARPPALDDGDPRTFDDRVSTTMPYQAAWLDVAPCYPAEEPVELANGPVFQGWVDDDTLVVRDAETWWRVRIDDAGNARAELAEPVYPDPSAAPSNLLDLPRLLTDEIAWPWLPTNPGLARRFGMVLDAHGVWLHDREAERDYLLQWWSALPFGPVRGRWQGSIAPDGRHVVVWAQGEGLWVAQLSGLPR